MPPSPATPIDLAALAERYDPASRDTFLSLYADLTDDRHETRLRARAREIRAALPDGEAREAFDAAFEGALKALARAKGYAPGSRGAAVFASPAHGFEEAHALKAEIPTLLVLDSSPYIRPLARFQDRNEAFLLALVDGERAAIYHVEDAAGTLVSTAKTRLIGRHKKGGMSQMRYQRHRQGVVDRYLDEVATRLARLSEETGARRLVVAGPGAVKRHFVERLPPALSEGLMAVEDADFREDSEDDLVRRFIALARREEARDSREAAEALKGEVRRGGLALLGAFDVARAARDGRVEILLVLEGAKAGGRKCEAHQAFFAEGAACACGSEGTGVDLMNEAIEGAVRSEARVEFVKDDAFLREAGGVGALLRW